MYTGQGTFGHCRGCGKQVLWIRTIAGKNMPCDPLMIYYRETPGGKEKIVLQDGRVVSGITDVDPGKADGIGYTSHFATCPSAGRFRRRSG